MVYKKEQHCQSVDIGPVHGPDFPGKILFFPNNGVLPSSAASPASMQPLCSLAGAAAQKGKMHLEKSRASILELNVLVCTSGRPGSWVQPPRSHWCSTRLRDKSREEQRAEM